MPKIKEKERTTILNALRAGVVPASGLKHIQVGRKQEIEEVIKDLIHVENSGSTVRFIVGDFGTGKSFFLTLCKSMAHEKKLVATQADITVDRILCSSDGKARSLITELIKNISCKAKPEGNALRYIIETWLGSFLEAKKEPTANDFQTALLPLSHVALSQDFANVLRVYFEAYRANDQIKMENSLKWIRAEYETKTEAKKDLGVSRIVEDADLYELIKLLTGFVRMAGYSGLMVNIDELAVLVRQRVPVRQKNYETLLMILNDCLQGSVEGLSFYFGATTEVIENKEKGLYSYGALETRLAQNQFARGGIRDLTGPVLKLETLTLEELYVLLVKLNGIYVNETENLRGISQEGIKEFLEHQSSRLGAEAFVNPREIIQNYLGLLSLLESYPEKSWSELLGQLPTAASSEASSNGLVKLRT